MVQGSQKPYPLKPPSEGWRCLCRRIEDLFILDHLKKAMRHFCRFRCPAEARLGCACLVAYPGLQSVRAIAAATVCLWGSGRLHFPLSRRLEPQIFPPPPVLTQGRYLYFRIFPLYARQGTGIVLRPVPRSPLPSSGARCGYRARQ